MIIIQLLQSIITGKNNLFFLQNKNFTDIVNQAYELHPAIVANHAILMGRQDSYLLANYSFPVALTDNIKPNIPAKLKKIVRNTDPDSKLSPAEALLTEFDTKFDKLLGFIVSKENPHEYFLAHAKGSASPLAPLLDFDPEISGETMRNNIIASYLYIESLIADGSIEPNESNIKTILLNIKKNFWNKVLKERDSFQKRGSGIVFTGKQSLNSYTISNCKVAPVSYEKNVDPSSLKVNSDLDITIGEIKKSVFRLPPTSHKNEQAVGMRNIGEKQIADILEPYFERHVVVPAFLLEASKIIIAMSNNAKNADKNDKVNSIKEGLKFIEKNAARTLDTMDDDVIQENFGVDFKTMRGIFKGSVGILSKVLEKQMLDTIELTGSNTVYPSFKYNISESMQAISFSPDLSMLERDALKEKITSMDDSLTEEQVDNIVSFVFDNIFDASAICEAINRYEYLSNVKTFHFRHIKGQNSTKSAADSIAPGTSKGSKIRSLHLSLSLQDADQFYSVVSYKAKDELASLDAFELHSRDVLINDQHQTVFDKSVVSPSLIEITTGQNARIDIVNALRGNGEPVNKLSSGDISMATPALWGFTDYGNRHDTRIGGFTTDEAHRDKGSRVEAFLTDLENHFPQATSITASGTILSGLRNFGRFIKSIAGNSDINFERSLIKHCAIKSFKSAFSGFVVAQADIDPGIRSEINIAVLDYYKSNRLFIDERTAFNAYLYDTSALEKVFQTLWSNPAIRIKMNLAAETQDLNSDFYSNRHAFFALCDDTCRHIIHPEIQAAKGDDLKRDFLSENLLSSFIASGKGAVSNHTKMMPGFTNPIGMADLLGYLSNISISIKRPSDDIKYSILNRDQIIARSRTPKAYKVDSSFRSDMLLFDAMVRNFRNRTQLSSVKRNMINLFELILNAIKHDPKAFGFASANINHLSNSTQKTVNDSATDIYIAHLMQSEIGDVPQERKELFEEKLKLVSLVTGYMQPFMQTLIKDPALTKEKEKAARLEHETFTYVIDNTPFTIRIDDLDGIQTSFNDINGHQATFVDSADDHIFYNIDKDGSLLFSSHGKLTKMPFSTMLSLEIDDRLPPIVIEYSLTSPQEREIIESIAFGDNLIRNLTDAINGGQNTRVMTTRVAVTQASIQHMVLAAAARQNKNESFSLLVAETDRHIKEMVDAIAGSSILRENNIEIIGASSNQISTIIDNLSATGKRIGIVGSFVSLAEGIDMSCIDLGFYPGAVNNIAAFIQSAARQVNGGDKTESRFYLADEEMCSISFSGLNNPQEILQQLSKGVNMTSPIDVNFLRVLHDRSGAIRTLPSFNIDANCNMLHYLEAYESFMTGQMNKKELLSKEDIENSMNAKLTVQGKIALGANAPEQENQDIAVNVGL